MPVKTNSFKDVMSLFPTGVTVVTTEAPTGQAYGVTVSSFTSVSLEPPLILVCLDNRLSGLDRFGESEIFVVNILSESQTEISNHFATPGTDRSETCGFYDPGPGGAPTLKESLAWMQCRPVDFHLAGDHTVLLGEVQAVQADSDVAKKGPLLYYRGNYRKLADRINLTSVAPERKDM